MMRTKGRIFSCPCHCFSALLWLFPVLSEPGAWKYIKAPAKCVWLSLSSPLFLAALLIPLS